MVTNLLHLCEHPEDDDLAKLGSAAQQILHRLQLGKAWVSFLL